MTITITPKYNSHSGTGHEQTILIPGQPAEKVLVQDSAPESYNNKATASRAPALEALRAGTPSSIGSLLRGGLSVDELHGDTTHPESSYWIGTVEYNDPGITAIETPPSEVGDTIVEFSIGGQTRHILASKQTVHRIKSGGGDAEDLNGAINVTDSGVEGCDIVIPSLTFDITKTYVNGQGAIPALKSLTGKVNSNAITVTDSKTGVQLQAAAGEALFLGGRGGRANSDGNFRLAMQIAICENETDVSAGGITIPTKKGWEFLWLRFRKTKSAVEKALIRKATAAYVERVYDEVEFSL